MSNKNLRKEYKKNFLTNVIFKLDFQKILELNEKNPPSEFQKKIADKFPITNELRNKLLEFETKKETEDVSVKQERTLSWEFMNKEKTKKVIVDSQFLIVEFLKYTTFEEFFQDIKFILGIFSELYCVKISKRIGLRYINQINIPSGDPLDWNLLINKDLFGLTKNFLSDKDPILRSMHLLEVKQESYTLRFQFGLFNSEYPNPIARKEFVLDYDCFSVEEKETSDIFSRIEEYHAVIRNLFEKSIMENLIKIMNGEII